MCDLSYTVTDKGIDISTLTNEIGFPVPVFINSRLWKNHLDLGDDCEFLRVDIILREYIEAVYDTNDDVSYFDIESDYEFYLYETLHLKAVLNDEELFISLKFDDIYELFEKAGLL